MAFNIKEFLSNIKTSGYLKPHDFEVFVALPTCLQGKTLYGTQSGVGTAAGTYSELLRMRATEAHTPDPMILSADIPRYGIGTVQQQPFNAKFVPTWITFMCDRNGQLWNFWHQWMNAIVEFCPVYNGQGGGTNNAPAKFLVEYKEKYASTVALDQYNQSGNLAIEYCYNYAFPVKLMACSCDWDNDKEIMELNVGLAYSNYSVSNSSLVSTTATTSTTQPLGARNSPDNNIIWIK